jgi:hypothetical protein
VYIVHNKSSIELLIACTVLELQTVEHFFVDTEYTISTGNDYHYHYIVDNGVDVRGQTSNMIDCL